MSDDRARRPKGGTTDPRLVGPHIEDSRLGSVERQVDMVLEHTQGGLQFAHRQLDCVRRAHEALETRFAAIEHRERELSDKVLYNARAANDNIEKVQDAFKVVTNDQVGDFDELCDRIAALAQRLETCESGAVATLDRVAAAEARAAQLGVVASSTLASQRTLSARVDEIERSAERHLLAVAIQGEVASVAAQGDTITPFFCLRARCLPTSRSVEDPRSR